VILNDPLDPCRPRENGVMGAVRATLQTSHTRVVRIGANLLHLGLGFQPVFVHGHPAYLGTPRYGRVESQKCPVEMAVLSTGPSKKGSFRGSGARPPIWWGSSVAPAHVDSLASLRNRGRDAVPL
jgi:hypothetical protein